MKRKLHIRNKVAPILFIALLLAVPLALLCFSDHALTGRFFAPSESFTASIGEIYSSSSSYVLNINESQPYNLKSVRMSGSFAGDHAKVYLKTANSSYVVFDSANLPKNGKVTDMISGALTEVASDSGSSADAGSSSVQPAPPPSSETDNAQTDSAVDTTAEGGSGAEIPPPEQPPVAENQTTAPQENQTIPAVNETLPGNQTQEIAPENATNITNETIITKEVALTDVCVDTCLLPDGIDASDYELVIEVENGQLLISNVTYSLLNLSSVPVNITVEIVDSNNNSVPADIALVNDAGAPVPEQTGLLSSMASTSTENSQSFEVKPSADNNLAVNITTTEVPIKAINFQNIQATEDVHAVIGVDNVPDNQSSMPGAVQVYAIDPTQLNFTEATVTVEATGSALYKCASWDFQQQSCTDGNWAFVQSITPGQDYNITLTANDPGYAEYNFTSTTNNKAWKSSDAGARPPANLTVQNETELNSTEYGQINASDDSRANVSSSTYKTFRFQFKLNENSSQINNLSVRWEGYATGTDSQPVMLYVWNWTNSSWLYVGNYSGNTSDGNITSIYTSGISSLVNSTNYVDLLSEANASAASQTFYTDFADVSVWNTSDVTPPSVQFVSPTPADGNSTKNSWIYINVSSSDAESQHYVLMNLNNSLAGWWRLEETSGTSFTDDSGKSNSGSCSGGTCPTLAAAGKYGKAPVFNGSQYVNFGNKSDFYEGMSNSNFSYGGWLYLYTNQSANFYPMGKGYAGTQTPFGFWFASSGNVVKFLVGKGNNSSCTDWLTTADLTSTWTANTWEHWFFVKSGTKVYLFKNGTQVSSYTMSNSTICDPTTTPFVIGTGSSSSGPTIGYINGSIDEVVFFNRALNNTEVAALYNATANQYYRNFTNLSVGNYTPKAYAVDAAGNKNNTETRTITLLNGALPTVTLVSPSQSYNVNTSDNQTNVTFQCNATDSSALVNISLYITNSSNQSFASNQTANITGTSNSTNWTLGLSTGNYTWNCLAYNSGNNSAFADANRSLIITYTADMVYPAFSNYSDNNGTLSGSGKGLFNVTVQNTNGTVYLNINNQSVLATNLTANNYNASYDFNSSGTYNYTWSAYGNGTNKNQNATGNITYVVHSFNLSSFYQYPTNVSPGGSVYSYCVASSTRNASSQLNTTIRYKSNASGSWQSASSTYLSRRIIWSIGDSITRGSPNYNPALAAGPANPVNSSYQYWLDYYMNSNASGLDSSNISVYNKGQGSDTCLGMDNRFNSSVGNNSVVILMCGINDFSLGRNYTQAEDSVTNIYNNAMAKNDALIILEVIPDSNGMFCGNITPFNSWLWSNMSNRANVTVVKTHAPMSNGTDCYYNNSLYVDGVHPNIPGHKVIVGAIWAALNKQYYESWTANVTIPSNETNSSYDFDCNISDGLASGYAVNYNAVHVKNVPSIAIISPTNTTYNTKTLLVNISAADADNVWYNWNGTNQTYANATNVTFAEGSNTLYGYANDSVGNLNSTNVTFTVHTAPPSVSFVSPTLPDGNTTNSSWMYVNVSSSDATSHYVINNFDSKLAGWWRLEQGNGTSFADDSGKGYNGSCPDNSSCPAYNSSGKYGGTYVFNGSQYVNFGNKSDFNESTPGSNFSYGGWLYLYTNQTANFYPFGKGYAGAYTPYSFWFAASGNAVKVIVGKGTGNSCTDWLSNANLQSTWTANTWEHWFFVKNGLKIYLYENGTQISNYTLSNDSVCDLSGVPFTISAGSSTAGPYIGGVHGTVNGSIDEVLFFNRALSDSEVAAMYNATANQYYDNFTNLSDGNHTTKAYAVDSLGNKNSTETRTITLLTDTNSPNVTIIHPENKTYNTQSNIPLDYTATDNVAVSKCWYAINGGTNTSLSNCNNATISTGMDGSYPITVYANDTSGNVGKAIQYFAVDTTPSQYSNPQSSTPSKYSASTLSLFNITWTDALSGMGTVLLESNYSGMAQNYSMYLISGNVYGYNITLPAGTFYWKSYANDSAGNLNASTQQTFTISKADNSVDLYLNGNKDQNLTITYLTQTNATSIASSGAAGLYRDGISVSNPEITTLAADTTGYEYVANTTGNQNYTSNSTKFYLFVNKASPTLSLLLDGVASDKSVSYGLQTNATGTASNAGDSDLTYNLYRNAMNAGSGASVSDVQTLGANTYAYIYNTSGGENYTSAAINRTLTVNKAATSAKLFLNGLESNTSQTYGTSSNATATLNVSGLTFQLLRNGTQVASGTSSINELGTLAAGAYNYTATFAGDENYTGSSATWYLTINKAIPALSLLMNGSDSDIAIAANTNITINSSSTTPSGATVYLYEDGSYVANGTSPSIIRNYTTLGDRIWKVNISASENYTSAEKTHTISVTDPDAPQYSNLKQAPTSPATYYPTHSYQFNATWTDNTNVSNVILEFNGANYSYSAGQLNRSGNEYYRSFYSLAAGTYAYKWDANDTSNNWGKTANQTYVLDKAITALFLTITPSNSVNYGTLTTISCSSNNLESSPTLTRNITSVSNPDANVLTAGIYNYACTAVATYNYTSAWATSTLTVNKAAPVINLTLNEQDSDITLPAGSSEVNATATLVAPGSGDLNLTGAGGVLFASGASPLQNSTSFAAAGTYTIAANYGGNDNYTTGSKSHNVVVQSAQQGGNNGGGGGGGGGSVGMPSQPSNITQPSQPVIAPENQTAFGEISEESLKTPGILGSAISVPPAKKPNPLYAVPTLLLMILLFAILAMGQSKLSDKAKKILTALHVSLIIIIILMLVFTFVKIPALTGGAIQVPVMGSLTTDKLLLIVPIAMLGISLLVLAWIRLKHTKGKKHHAERNVKKKKQRRKSRKKR